MECGATTETTTTGSRSLVVEEWLGECESGSRCGDTGTTAGLDLGVELPVGSCVVALDEDEALCHEDHHGEGVGQRTRRWGSMTWIAVGAALVALGLVADWFLRDNVRPVLTGTAAVVAVVSGWFAWQAAEFERELAEVVVALSGRHDAKVDCQGFMREFRLDNNLGEVAYDGKGGTSNTAQLRGAVCDAIADWQDDGHGAHDLDQVIAVHVLTHEAYHVVGLTSEGRAECYAMQSDARVAEMLGATPQQARALSERYWNEVFPRMPGQYRAIECVPDGELDLNPGDGIWP